MKKAVILQTINEKKFLEYVKIFSKYDIEVIMSDEKYIIEENGEYSLDILKVKSLFLNNDLNPNKDKSYISIMADESNLYNSKTGIISDKREDMELVKNITQFYYVTPVFPEILSKFEESIDGWIDLSNRMNDTFGWDDIFIVSNTGLSYEELSKRNLKISPRNKLISKFIEKNVYYEKNIDLNFNKQNQDRTIEFDNKVIKFINENKYLSLPLVKESFSHIFNISMDNGAFFRSAKNRREKNYWLPGMNSGIPLVPKKDEIHEITFAVHDLCHFVMPDLIISGREFDQFKNIDKKVYTIYRMMSEAITMVFADMLFIDKLVKSNIDYDFAKRKIYPLYNSIMKYNPETNIKDILYANVRYCLMGDDTFYKKLLNEEDLIILEEFKIKYEPFFVEDFKWTEANYNNMNSNKKIFKKWFEENEDLIKEQNLTSISLFDLKINVQQKSEMKVEELVDSTFKYVLDNLYFNNTKKEELEEQKEEKFISNSFKKYMLGQMFIFYKYDFLAISKPYLNKIKSVLEKAELTKNEIDKIRDLYDKFLFILKDQLHLIDEDDYLTYKEVYPIFDSFYVFYDKEKTYYKSLSEVSNDILGR